MTQRVLDVSHLEDGTADSRALLWWGNLGMMAIEGAIFAMLIATYLYLRVVNLDWPPSTVRNPDLLWPSINLGILLLTFVPALILDRAALHDNVPLCKLALAACVVAGAAFLTIQSTVLANLGYKWSDHAYGSIVWTAVGYHMLHVIAAAAETALLLVYSLVRPIVKKQLLDFRCTAVYWYFVILMWLPFYFIVFIEPYLTRKGLLMETTKDIDVRPSSVALWTGILAGPFAWALVFELKYALIDYVCRNHAHWLFWIFFLLGIAICAFGALSGWRGMAEGSPRARFMGIGGIALSAAFAIFIIAMSIPDLYLRPCE